MGTLERDPEQALRDFFRKEIASEGGHPLPNRRSDRNFFRLRDAIPLGVAALLVVIPFFGQFGVLGQGEFADRLSSYAENGTFLRVEKEVAVLTETLRKSLHDSFLTEISD